MDPELLKGFYLGDFLVEPAKGQVTGRSESTHLPPKAMEVLLCLAQNPTEIVEREQLLKVAWGSGGSAETLSHAVGEIRHALDDHRENPSFIQTLPKRGYRLLVTPERVSEGTSSVVIGVKNGAKITDIGFLENLRRRGVIETGLAYLVVGWLLIQIADIVFDQLLLPDWVGTFVTVLVITGFPIAVLLSWFLEFRDGRAVFDDRSPVAARRRRFSRTYVSVLGALAIAAIGVFLYDEFVGLPTDDSDEITITDTSVLPPIEDNSIAVLRFLALDPSEKTAIFSNGIAEDVITSLSRVPGLLVASRGDSFTLEPNTPSQDVRDRLRVAKYVEGSIQIDGDMMRVVVQLVDSTSGFHILSRTFDRQLGDYFNMRDEITELTVANVRVALPPETRPTPTAVQPDPEIDVYVMYRRGVEASRQPDLDGWSDEALRWFDAALEVDPDYAAAHAGKCDVLVQSYAFGYEAAQMEAAESSCAMALHLNPNLDVVYTSLGDLRTATGQYDAAEMAYLDALELDPNNSAALIGLGEVYRLQQRLDDAEDSIRKAIGLHPGEWSTYNALGLLLFRSGRFSEAVEQFRIVVALDDTNIRGLTNLGSTLLLAEEFKAAEPVLRRAIDLEPKGAAYSNLGMLLYNLGRFEEAVDAHRNAVELEQQDYLTRSNLGDALWVSGKRTEALNVFRIAEELAAAALSVNANDPFIQMDMAWIKTVLDRHEEAQELINRAKEAVPDDPYVHYIQGLMWNRKGNTDEALDSLKAAAELGYSTKLLSVDPNLANLRENKKFERLLTLSK